MLNTSDVCPIAAHLMLVHESSREETALQAPEGEDISTGPVLPPDEDELVGPPMPLETGDGDDGDAWDDRGLGEADEQEDPYRLPVTSEIALEGKHQMAPC